VHALRQQREKLFEDEAQLRIRKRDLSDVDWIRRYLGLDSHDPALFDLIFNTSRIAPAIAAELVVKALSSPPARSR
jgi:cytidylate kinase